LVAYLLFRFGIPIVANVFTGRPAPIPGSLLSFYMLIVLLATLLLVSSNEAWWAEFRRPIRRVLIEDENRPLVGVRYAILVLTPLLVGYWTVGRLTPTAQAPAELRAIHPAPPDQIAVGGEAYTIQGLDNPFWKGPPEEPDPTVVEEGRAIYGRNCVFCHGDALAGDGLFAEGLNPRPADFTDTGTIAQLQQSYLFWRIAKGGPGLPSESAPWNSGMPAWENTLRADEIWKVIVYLYEAAGPAVEPRTWEE
jgi:mono/diheme cytochrome c family protein